MSLSRPKVALIAGPTASGKSALAVAIAEAADGIVINADSAQVYADLAILTARPSPDELARVPHCLYGHVDGQDAYSAARWAEDARSAIGEATATGKLPVLVGGTGLYFRTLLDGIAPVPPIDPAIRAEVRAMAVGEAYRMLRSLDLAAAMRLQPNDTTRIARALEVIRSTGRTLADWQSSRRGGIREDIDLAPLILLPDREWLLSRCDMRLELMFGQGAVAEVVALLARDDVPVSAPVRQAIGVREIAAWQSGEITREEALARAKVATRQYAKRQYTWFRNQPPAEWLRTSETDTGKLLGLWSRAE